METSYQVVGMTCEHCERRVQSEVSLLPGVESVRADAGSATLVVVSGSPLDLASVREAVEEAGYELAHD
ncbi:heavy-metal-associated domain-containing protein [Leifsonia sp. L25]|uniref:heavy-metal-associated domain-containing protein n=1 Tax=Actinomycetes TaxID=1760 RepID=UPI003D689E30